MSKWTKHGSEPAITFPWASPTPPVFGQRQVSTEVALLLDTYTASPTIKLQLLSEAEHLLCLRAFCHLSLCPLLFSWALLSSTFSHFSGEFGYVGIRRKETSYICNGDKIIYTSKLYYIWIMLRNIDNFNLRKDKEAVSATENLDF
jgi:hypothetical protein